MSGRLTFATQGLAQVKADAVHAWMIANAPWYAQSVSEGRTLACCKPYQDRDPVTKLPIGTLWYLNFKDRHLGALTAPEILSLL